MPAIRSRCAVTAVLVCSMFFSAASAGAARNCAGCDGSSCGSKSALAPATASGSSILDDSSLFQLTRAMNNLAARANTDPESPSAMQAVETVNLGLSDYLLAVRNRGREAAISEQLMQLNRLQRLARDVIEADRYIDYMRGRMKQAVLSRKGDQLLTEFLARLRGRAYRDLLLQLDRLRADDVPAEIYRRTNDGMAGVLGGFTLIDAVAYYGNVLHVADAEERLIHGYRFQADKDGGFPLRPVKIGTIDALAGGEGETQGIIYDTRGNLLVVDEGGRRVHILKPAGGAFTLAGAFEHPADLMEVPRGITVMPGGQTLVSDGKIRKIHVFDKTYRYRRSFDVFPGEHTQIECMIPLDEDSFIITNEFGHTLGVYTLRGEARGEFGRRYFAGQPEGIVRLPVTVNGRRAFMVVDELMGELEIFSLAGRCHLKTIRLGTGEGLYNLKSPDGITVGVMDGVQYLFISDQENARVVIYNLDKLIAMGDFSIVPDDELLGICNDLYDFMAARKFGLGSVTGIAHRRARLALRMAEYIEANPFGRAMFDRTIGQARLGIGIDIDDQPLAEREIDRLMADTLKMMPVR